VAAGHGGQLSRVTLSDRIARLWFAATTLIVLGALALQIAVSASASGGGLASPGARVANLFAYFTIQSNLIVALASCIRAIEPRRTSFPLQALWVAALLGIGITAIVFHIALRGLQALSPAGQLADSTFHIAVPILFLLGWLLFGPRGIFRLRTALAALLFPFAWLAFTMARGALTGFYPYPFLDANQLSALAILRNCGAIAALFAALAALFGWIDARLTCASRS
jgi:hypothetical protein